MSIDDFYDKRRYLDRGQIAEAFFKRKCGWSDEDVASFFGITLQDLQISLGLPQFKPMPPMDRPEGKR